MTTAVAAPQLAGRPRVLCVDDEENVLDGLASNLRREFEVLRATSGAAGLDILAGEPDICVVMSDMRMPGMNGAQFLTRARMMAPDTVRLLLTGQADVASAIAAINDGQVFRFLTKPCPRDRLVEMLGAAVVQYRLVTSERVLLEQTLRGSVKMLVDVLALSNPTAFGRANRIKTLALRLAAALDLFDVWQLEVAALSSQLGYIVLPHELCDKLQRGHVLSDDERRLAATAPAMTERLLGNIPRLEEVREILRLQALPRNRTATKVSSTVRAAHILRVALDFDALTSGAARPSAPLEHLRAHAELYDPMVLDALDAICGDHVARNVIKEVALPLLRTGMVFAEDVRLASGALVVAHGYEVTPGFIERVRNFPDGAVRTPLWIVAT